MENKEPTVITPAEVHFDNYGGLNVTDTLGAVTKINKKHDSLHSLFQSNIGRAIKVYWKYYDVNGNQGFAVDNAQLFNPDTSDADVGGPKVDSPTAPKPTPKAPQTAAGKSDPKNRSFALAYAKDLTVSGVIDRAKILSYAEYFARYMDGTLEVEDKEVAELLLN